MNRIALLPLDDRPVNYDYPAAIGRVAGLEVLLPDRGWLGNPWRPSQHGALLAWLESTAPQVDALVIAVDTVAHGGLVPSRVSSDSTQTVLERLEVLRALRSERPATDIAAFSVIQRVSRDDTSEEERPYWADFGSRLFRLSYLEHKAAEGEATPAELDEGRHLRDTIPPEHREDYLAIRARNHAVNRAMLDHVEDGVIDYLVLGQDDTAAFGWNIAEARRLQAAIRMKRLTDRAVSYPATDELGCLLVARSACVASGFAPKVWPRYSASSSVVTAYEDRPLQELLKAHLSPLRGIIATGSDEADILLFVNGPAEAQGNGELQWLVREGMASEGGAVRPSVQEAWTEQASSEAFRRTRREMQTALRSPEESVRALLAALATGRPVALADVAFVNGADLVLGDELLRHPEVARLAAYAGWNTASNTLGTALAQAVARAIALRRGPSPEAERAQVAFLFLRLVDDYIYQARVRSQCMYEDLPELGWEPTMGRLPEDIARDVLARLRRRLDDAVNELSVLFARSDVATGLGVTDPCLPWQRLFEIQFKVSVGPPDPRPDRR